MRIRFDEQLEQLNVMLIDMGALCEEAITYAVKAFEEDSDEMRRMTYETDRDIDERESEIENVCLKLLLQQQPVARDLRQISAALKMITDMERIGDQAEDIAEIIGIMEGRGAENGELMYEMAKAAMRMVTESVDAYVKHDIIAAEKVIADDDTVDDFFDKVKYKLIEKIARDPSDGEYALDLLMIAKYFERIGDHAVNIAEWVIFSITGEHEGS